MDGTIPGFVCDKIADPAKREKCKSLDNVSAIHECTAIGNPPSLPEKIIKSWNVIASIGKIVNNSIKKP
jgi:hypothetical protein